MSATPISAFLITFNEIDHIAEAIGSVSALDEVIVVDSGSTDGTAGLAADLGARVIHQDWLGFAAQKAFALAQCRNEWCLNIDGDEVVPPALLDEIRGLVDTGRCDMIRLPIDDLFMDRLGHRLSRRRSIVRVFRASTVEYPTDRHVHENVIGDGREVTTSQHLFHYGYNDPNQFMSKYSHYAKLRAMDKHARGKRGSLLKLVVIFPLAFIKALLLRRLVFSGRRGFVQAMIEAMYAFLKEAHLLQMNSKNR